MAENKHSAIEMRCPYCGTYGSHLVTRTEPEPQLIPSELHLGTRDGFVDRYRARTRSCSRCCKEFRTAEVWETIIKFAYDKIREMRETNEALANECKWLKIKLQQISAIINRCDEEDMEEPNDTQ